MARDTPWGAGLRSPLLLGVGLPGIGQRPADIAQRAPDDMGPALLAHCHNEFTCLRRFLPSLFIAESKATHAVPLPW